ncbi:MAG: CsgG/HfaB family protein [Candidatus Competibacteraceae bacterium]|nr:CsgG/HfaB family protein [Candidatus Competibacteraceae bacterium]
MGRIALRIVGFAFALGCWLLAGPIQAAGNPSGERMTATVVEFSVRGDLPDHAGAIMADLMVSAIANTGSFTLKDRLSLAVAARIAKAQELGATGLLDPKTAAELGRLYGVDAIVTGGISKLGDLITVQARLFDTKTAALLRSGQIQGRDLDTIQIKVNELAAMITAPPEPPKTYALTIKTEPADASVRLLSSPTPYQPGVRLAPGEYEVEVTREDYVARRESVRIAEGDVTVTLALEPAKFGLTIRPRPEDARVRLLDSAVAYQPGVALAPGNYDIEVSRDGYVSRTFPVTIADSEVEAPVVLEEIPPPPPPPSPQYRLTVRADPPTAQIRLLGIRTAYQAGVRLEPGSYTVEVSQTGYESVRVPVRIADSDVTVPVTLVKQPEPSQYRLTVRATPGEIARDPHFEHSPGLSAGYPIRAG